MTERTVLYAPGLRQPVRKVEPFLTALSEYGFRTIVPERRFLLPQRKLEENFLTQAGEWPAIQLAKANDLYCAIVESGAEQVDIVGYCEGGVTGTILAGAHPEVVSQLVLVNPAGMTHEESPDRLTGRFRDKNRRYIRAIIEDVMAGKIDRTTYQMAWSNVNRILGMRALASLSGAYIPDTLKDLADHGMKISLIHGYADRLYPYDRVNSNAPNGLHAYASLADSLAGHAVFNTHSNEVTAFVLGLLEDV